MKVLEVPGPLGIELSVTDLKHSGNRLLETSKIVTLNHVLRAPGKPCSAKETKNISKSFILNSILEQPGYVVGRQKMLMICNVLKISKVTLGNDDYTKSRRHTQTIQCKKPCDLTRFWRDA